MKAVKGKLVESKPERVEAFEKGASTFAKKIIANFKDYEFYVGEKMDPDGMVALLNYREDGITRTSDICYIAGLWLRFDYSLLYLLEGWPQGDQALDGSPRLPSLIRILVSSHQFLSRVFDGVLVVCFVGREVHTTSFVSPMKSPVALNAHTSSDNQTAARDYFMGVISERAKLRLIQ